jgi:hypothetical protein
MPCNNIRIPNNGTNKACFPKSKPPFKKNISDKDPAKVKMIIFSTNPVREFIFLEIRDNICFGIGNIFC